MRYVALIQQGMVLDQKVIDVGDDRDTLQAKADAEAQRLNSGAQESEGWTSVVLPMGELST